MNKSVDFLSIDNSTFWAMVIHDLKTPIIAEICALELLLKNKPSSSFEYELINDMLSASKYMKTLVENLLLKYKSDKNEFVLQLEPCPLDMIISKSIEEIQYLILDKKQRVVFKNYTKTSICNIDYIEIKRALNNLLTNANQYAPSKSIINIELKENFSDFVVKISNRTILQQQEFNVNNFSNPVENSKYTKSVNAGLGLFICKKIIELHNGQIFQRFLSDNRNQFEFRLPKNL